MPMITPPGGWNPEHPDAPQNLERMLRYAYDPSVLPHAYAQPPRESWVRDLNALSGAQARRLSFGTVFGATSGYYLARLLMALLNLTILAAIVFVIVMLVSGSNEHSAAQQETSETPAVVQRVEPAQPIETPPSLTSDEPERHAPENAQQPAPAPYPPSPDLDLNK